MKHVGAGVSGLKHWHSTLGATSTLVAAGKVTVYGIQLEAGSAEVQYLQLHDKATAAEVSGTQNPDVSFMVPASDGVIIPPSSLAPLHHFANGLVIRASKTNRNDATAPTANPTVSIWYAVN